MTNKAVLEVIKNQTHEYNRLLSEHNTFLEVHTKTVNDYFKLKEEMKEYLDDNADIEAERYKVKKQNKDLRAILIRFERDNKRLEESLDECQRALEDKE